MASKRKLDSHLDKSLSSRIPALSRSVLDISSIPKEDDKENSVAGSTQASGGVSQAAKKLKIETSTPKPNATSTVPGFKAPRPVGARGKAILSGPSVRPKAGTQTRKPLFPTPASTRQMKEKPTVAAASSTSGANASSKISNKRPAWDVKGRLADLEAEFASLKGRSDEKTVECDEKSTLVTQIQTSLQRAQEECRSKDSVLASKDLIIADTEAELRLTKARMGSLETNLDYSMKRMEALEKELKDARLNLKSLNFEVQSKNADLERKDHQLVYAESQVETLKARVHDLESRVDYAEKLATSLESERKKLNNEIVELKGNIRVFCRVRPPLQAEYAPPEYISFLEGGQAMSVTKPLEPNEAAGKNRTKTEFSFDKVFGPDTSQSNVFEEISQLVQSALDGYNVCIFAYGQTGSGKTYTMEGPMHIQDFVLEAHNPALGMIPRAVSQVFDTARALGERGWQHTMHVSILEIYNEVLRDLLCSSNSKQANLSLQKGTDSALATTTTTKVTCEMEVYNLLKKARKNRAVAATSCNEYSSRSHSIFILKISSFNEKTAEKHEGILNLVDLAGSERLKEMSLDGARLRETKNINKSLSNLSNVIMALAQKAEHVPYRNSKLTHLLMNSLGGKAKTLMFVNVSPKEENYTETLNSLRFGIKVNNCNIGTASKTLK